jgi:hypothetical protein
VTFKLKYMPLYGNDFWADQNVKLMTDRMEAWYLRLLWDQFLHDSLPDDPMYLYALASPKDVAPDDPEWERFMGFVERLFPVEKRDGRRRNPRMAEERNRQWAIYRARKQAAEATNKAKQDNKLDGDRSGERGGRRHASVTHTGIGKGIGTTTSVSKDTDEPSREPWNDRAAKTIRDAGITGKGVGNALRWWKDAREVRDKNGKVIFHDDELAAVVRDQAKTFGPFQPAKLWNVHNDETSNHLRRRVDAIRKTAPAVKVADLLQRGTP